LIILACAEVIMAGGISHLDSAFAMSNASSTESGEDRLIARYFKPLAKHPGAFGLRDDAAVIAPPAGYDLVVTADGVVAGVHFFPDDPPDMVARKALRVNLSDLAAKGARPLGFLLTLALPRETGDAWLAPFARGLGADAEMFECPLLGGDTVRTPGPVTISIAAFGAVPHGRMVRRAGAQPGDHVMVTGTIGDAALGLLLRRAPANAERWGLAPWQSEHLAARYLVPEPRTAIAAALAAHVSAAMDVSDGLAGDLAKLCGASGVAADIDAARVPLSDAARAAVAKDGVLLETVITGGDDYEVLATVPPGQVETLRKTASAVGIALTDIGTVVEGRGEARFLDARGKPLMLAHPSFSHF
jgi:thiamine-monophosphate kinase